MIKILFICHGNICRSPMAEFIMKKLVDIKGVSDQFYIESAATSTEEIGNDMKSIIKEYDGILNTSGELKINDI